MRAPLKKEDYPRYFKSSGKLLAFLSPDKMFKIENIGSNKNEGVTIDFYITRKMVMHHWPGDPWKSELTPKEFTEIYNRLFSAYLQKIMSHV